MTQAAAPPGSVPSSRNDETAPQSPSPPPVRWPQYRRTQQEMAWQNILLSQQFFHIPGKLRCMIYLSCARRDPLSRNFTYRFYQHLFFFGQMGYRHTYAPFFIDTKLK